MNGLVFRPYREGDEIEINRLFNQVFGKSRTIEEWRWKFPKKLGEPNIMTCWYQGKLVAHNAGWPAKIQVLGRTWNALQSIDAFSLEGVYPKLSRQGLWAKTTQQFLDTFGKHGSFPLHYGIPGRKARKIARLFLSSPNLPETEIWEWELDAGNPPKRFLMLKRLPFVAKEVPPDDPLLDKLWDVAGRRYRFAVIRDRSWLGWRLADAPGWSYRRFLVTPRLSSSTPVAFFAFRVQQHEVLWVDAVWDGESEGSLLMGVHLGVELAREYGAGKLRLWMTGDIEAIELILKAGFRGAPERNGLKVLFRAFDDELANLITRAGPMYVTMADADLV